MNEKEIEEKLYYEIRTLNNNIMSHNKTLTKLNDHLVDRKLHNCEFNKEDIIKLGKDLEELDERITTLEHDNIINNTSKKTTTSILIMVGTAIGYICNLLFNWISKQ